MFQVLLMAQENFTISQHGSFARHLILYELLTCRQYLTGICEIGNVQTCTSIDVFGLACNVYRWLDESKARLQNHRAQLPIIST